MKDPSSSKSVAPRAGSTIWRRAVAIVVAGALGAAAGALAVSVLPAESFAWSGIALLPLFIVLESLLKHVLPAFAGDANAARMSLAGTIVVCFYAAWFVLRSA